MIRRYLQCDICGDKWDITDIDLSERVNPGLIYMNNRALEGVRQFKLMKLTALDEDRISVDNLDICDGCYNKLDRFIYELANGEDESEI